MKASSYIPGEPIAAAATPLVPSALGIIRTSGKSVIKMLSGIFSRPEALTEAAGNTLIYGWIVRPENNKQRIDEVMVAVYRAPRSFSGEEMAEIICHGGPATVTAILNLLFEHGFRQAEPGEFTFRGFVNGKADLTKAEAVREIIEAKTDESRARAVCRLAGSLHNEIIRIKDRIMHILASIEVEIEYPEEEVPSAAIFNPAETLLVCGELEKLALSWASEKLYQDGAKAVLCGRTNAGKSSLFNTLLKEERAIVSDIHGTTRDWLESWASFAGIPVRLFDTAGLRQTDDTIEQTGVQRTLDLTEEADLILYVVDASEGLMDEDTQFLSEHSKKPVLLVLNKADRISKKPEQTSSDIQCVYTSAKTGSGTDKLVEAVKNILTEKIHSDAGSGSAAIGSRRQKRAVQDALSSLRHAIQAAEEGYPLDAIAQDIEDSLTSLGEITGEITSADILDTVFSDFCVGK